MLVLPVRAEELRRHLTLHVGVLRVLREADDLDVEGTVPGVGGHALAHHVAAQIEFLRERFVDDGYFRGAGGVGACELASRDERNAERPEISGADFVVARFGVRVRSRLKSFHADAVAPVAAGEQRHEPLGDASHAGQRGQVVLEALEQLRGLLRLVPVQLRRDAERDHVLRLQAEIHAADVE